MKQIKKIGLWCVLLFACIQISGCGDSQTSWKSGDHEISSELTYEKSMDLDYATEFAVDYYENGFTLISISDGSRFLLNTEGEQVPEDLEKGITVLNAPVSDIYLVADVLGHSDVNTTRKHYADMDDYRKRRARNTVQLREHNTVPDTKSKK